MILRSLHLQSYRGFASQTFPFSHRVTVIAGINGRGKSSILDATALLLSNLLPKVTPAIGGYKYLSEEDIKIGAERLEIGIQASFEAIPVDFSISKDRTSRQIPTTILRQVREEILRIYGDPTDATDSAPIAVYYTTDRASFRLPKRLLSILRVNQAAAYRGALVNRQIDYRDFMSRFKVWKNSRAANDQATIALIEQVVGQFLTGFSEIEIQEGPLRLTVRKGDDVLDLTQLSDGERSTLAILMDLCRRLSLANPGLEDPAQGKGVVLIDEIELHLHPKWQREIVDKFREAFPNLQFIFTTHSPFVIQSLRSEEELILLDGQTISSFANKSINEVSQGIMGVANPQVSIRYEAMRDAAKHYLEILEETKMDPAQKLEAYKQRLSEAIDVFAENPAYQAFLEMKRAGALGE